MSNKPIIEVNVNDQQFRAFFELFQQYSTQVEEMPSDWKKINGATADAGKSASDFAKHSDTSKEALMLAAIQADAIGKKVGEAIKAQKEFATAARNGSSELEKMAKHAKTLGAEVFGIGKFLMKIGTLGFAITGLGAVLSGLGLRDLARSAISTQRDARGIGVSTGQLSAFQTDFGRYVDPSILNRAAGAQSDMTQIPFAMLATGQSFSAIQSERPDELALRMMQRAHDWYNRTPVAMRNEQTLRATGLDRFMNFEEVRRLGAMTSQEFSEAQANYRKDARAFSVSDKSTDAWYEFEREIEAAGKVLKTDLTDRLSELAPNLRDFVHTFTDDAKELIDRVLTKDNLKRAGNAIDDFVHWLESPALKNAIDDTATLLGKLASGLRALGLIPDRKTDQVDPSEERRESHGAFGATSLSQSGVPEGAPWTSEDIARHPLGVISHDDHWMGNLWHGVKKLWGYDWSHPFGRITHDTSAPSVFGSISGPTNKGALLSSLEQSSNLPSGFLDEVWNTESSRGKRLLSPAGAKGDFGFMDATAKQYGVDVTSFESSAHGAAHMYSDSLKKYHGDIRKALAGYNWGIGHVDRDIAKNGTQWESHLPAETRAYLNKITTALARRSAVNLKVDVQNSTAARVAVSTNAAVAGS